MIQGQQNHKISFKQKKLTFKIINLKTNKIKLINCKKREQICRDKFTLMKMKF